MLMVVPVSMVVMMPVPVSVMGVIAVQVLELRVGQGQPRLMVHLRNVGLLDPRVSVFSHKMGIDLLEVRQKGVLVGTRMLRVRLRGVSLSGPSLGPTSAGPLRSDADQRWSNDRGRRTRRCRSGEGASGGLLRRAAVDRGYLAPARAQSWDGP